MARHRHHAAGQRRLGSAVTVFYVDVAPLVPALHSVWFAIHIQAMVAGAGFNLGAVAAVLYFLRSRAEARGGEVRGYLARVPATSRLDSST